MSKTESKGYDYIQLKKLQDGFLADFPFLKSCVLGRSCNGHNITALQIGTAAEYALITAAFHGSEYITSTVLMFFIEELCTALQQHGSIAGFDARRALYGRGVIFVPRVNPDGCEIALRGEVACGNMEKSLFRICQKDFAHWNANLRGVDINHNFNAGWNALKQTEQQSGIFAPAATRFGGYKPESEPETLALTQLCRKKRIRHAVALHSQGEVIYWNYGEKTPPKSEKMAQIMATSSGYTLDTPEGLAVGGGFKDWFIEEFNRPGFTVELGLGKNPLPADTARDIYEKVREMLMLCTIM